MRVTRKLQIQGLLHDERRVRDTLLQLLGDQGYSGADATRAALAAIGKWGFAEAFEYPHQLCRLALDDSCFETVLEELENGTQDRSQRSVPLREREKVQKVLFNLSLQPECGGGLTTAA